MVIKDKSRNNSILNHKSIETEEIIGRLKEALGVTSDGQLAKFIGISRQNIGAARKRQDVPPGWIYKVAALTGYSMDWIHFGQGAKIREEYKTGESHQAGRIASPQSPFQIKRRPGAVVEGPHDEDSTGFGAAVEMLAKIYSSGDKLLINTINANIRAFCEAINSKQREQHSTKQLENLKKRLIKIEKQLERVKPRDGKAPKSNG
jgi:hypothetical protein